MSRINGLRTSRGLAPLEVHGDLVAATTDWASHLADIDRLEHDGDLAGDVGVRWSKLGENVGFGTAVGPVLGRFVASPGHFANLVDPQYTHLGVRGRRRRWPPLHRPPLHDAGLRPRRGPAASTHDGAGAGTHPGTHPGTGTHHRQTTDDHRAADHVDDRSAHDDDDTGRDPRRSPTGPRRCSMRSTTSHRRRPVAVGATRRGRGAPPTIGPSRRRSARLAS